MGLWDCDFGTLDFALGLHNNSLLEMTLEDKINLERDSQKMDRKEFISIWFKV